MSEIYTNIPEKSKDRLEITIEKLKTNQYVENFELKQNDYDAAISFFVKRGFDREPAEQISYVILKQAKIDSVPAMEVLDIISKASPVQLSELMSFILNSSRVPSSRLGLRNQRDVKEFVSRNIIA
jgi:hypothetical protein